jgi:hypothetical protein
LNDTDRIKTVEDEVAGNNGNTGIVAERKNSTLRYTLPESVFLSVKEESSLAATVFYFI